MANLPRAGIINLDFTDVSKMAQNIQANDPWKNLISTTGKILSDRERNILYRRAQAQQLGLEPPDETTAVEAVGKGVDWVGDKLGEGVRAVKRKLLAPDMEGYVPAHATDAYKAQEKMTGYNPISEEAKAMEGYKPTNMEGYNPLQMIREPSSLKSPSATDEQEEPVEEAPEAPEAPQESASPVADVEVRPTTLKAPRARSEAENWSEMYRLNPQRARFDYNREKDATNFAVDLANKQADLESKYNPDSVRFKLASRSNAISSQLTGLASNDPAYKPLLDEQKRIKLELAKDNPSIKSVYAEPSLDDEKDEKDVDGVANQPPTYVSIQSDIDAATKENFEAVASKVADDKGKAKLSDEQAKRVDDLLAERKKKLFPPKAPTNSQVVDKLWGDMDANTQKRYSEPTSLYNAGVSNYGQGLYGTAIQNFIKAANPGEAVMPDDVTMANKGQVSSGLLVLLKKIGYDATNDNVQDIASRLKVTAENSVRARLDALDSYDLTPEQRKLFITRYMNGVNLGGAKDGGKEPKQGKTPAPVVGTVVNGYKFIGGDPKDKNNWEKQ